MGLRISLVIDCPRREKQETELEAAIAVQDQPAVENLSTIVRSWLKLVEKTLDLAVHRVLADTWARQGSLPKNIPRFTPGRQRLARQWALLGSRLNRSRHLLRRQ